jgi:hypothetical protein
VFVKYEGDDLGAVIDVRTGAVLGLMRENPGYPVRPPRLAGESILHWQYRTGELPPQRGNL